MASEASSRSGALVTFRSPNDPYRDSKKVHRAAGMRSDGAVSALCFKRRRPINLDVASWTNRDDAVTCLKCMRILKARPPSSPKED